MSLGEEQQKTHSLSNTTLDEIDLKELLLTIWHHKWFIILVTTVVFCFSIMYVLRIPTQYQTSALIQVENSQTGLGSLAAGSGVVGLQSGANQAQIEAALIKSRYILTPIVEKYHLDRQVSFHYFPFFGSFIANMHGNTVLAKPFLGMSSYAWGGEILDVSQFKVPFEYGNQKFILIAGEGGSYALYSPEKKWLFNGMTNQCERMNVSEFAGLEICVNQLRANKGEEFYLISYPMTSVVDSFSQSLKISDVGVSDSGTGASTGILNVFLTGGNAKLLPKMLNFIIHYEVKKNTEKKLAELKLTLDFLNKQLPVEKEGVDQAETALSQYRAKTGSFGLDSEAQMFLQQLVDAQNNLEQKKFQKTEMLLRYTDQHPYIIALNTEINAAQQKLDGLKTVMQNLPKTEQLAIDLERNAQVKNQMYLSLLTQMQQLQVAQAGTISDVRILGEATSVISLPTKKSLILLGGVIFGFVFAVMIIFMRKLFEHNLADPDYVEDHLGVPAFAIIPYSRTQEKLTKEMKRKMPGAGSFVLAERHPKELPIEGLRSLRTTLQFALLEAKNNIISVTGSSPGIGKSFISVNLAYVLADSGKKILLIDADMRKGKIYEYLSDKREPGFADILSSNILFEQAKQVVNDKIDFIATGHYPKNPSELLIGDKLKLFLEQVSKNYDIVLIDTPPVLAVTDAVLLTKQSGINLLVIGAGKEELKEIEHTVKRLRKNQVKIDGLIFNSVKSEKKTSGYGSYYYYDYESSHKK